MIGGLTKRHRVKESPLTFSLDTDGLEYNLIRRGEGKEEGKQGGGEGSLHIPTLSVGVDTKP